MNSSAPDLDKDAPSVNGKVLVVGSINLDLVTKVKSFPRPGETLLGSDYRTHHGGKGANQAVAAARMGAEVSFIGRVGHDDFGARLRAGLAEEGINTAALATVEAASGVAFITLDDNSQNTIIVAPGANHWLNPRDLSPESFESTDVVVLQLEIPAPTVKSVIRLANQAGVMVLVNAAPAGTMAVADLQGCDVLVVNETEAATLLGVDDATDPEPLVDELAEHFAAVVITLGSKGVVWRGGAGGAGSAGGPAGAGAGGGRLAPHEVSVIDTTAAGDAFVGAMAAALARGLDLVSAVRWGSAAGALAVGREGAQPSLPRLDEVEGLLR